MPAKGAPPTAPNKKGNSASRNQKQALNGTNPNFSGNYASNAGKVVQGGVTNFNVY